jgi:acyl-CoA reductase-like NAD-dependent aldehyde dehydrogenase
MAKLDVTTLKFSNIINGKPVSSERIHKLNNPATGAWLADVPIATSEQLDDCVAAARAAQPAWGAKSYDERAVVLNKLADELENNVDVYSQLLTAEQGKPVSVQPVAIMELGLTSLFQAAGAMWEIGGSVRWLRETAQLRLEETVHVDTPERRVVTRNIPLGVVRSCFSSSKQEY